MTGLRERKKQATRQALALAAIRLAVVRGLDNVSVEDIAAEAGVSPRTFNNYFGSKHEAICALAEDRAVRIGAALRERPDDEPLWDAVRHALLSEYTAEAAPDPAWSKGVRRVTSAPALVGEYLKTRIRVRDALAEAVAERTGHAPDDLFPVIFAGAVTTGIDLIIDRWLDGDPPAPIQSYVDDVIDELRSIVNTPTGKEKP